MNEINDSKIVYIDKNYDFERNGIRIHLDCMSTEDYLKGRNILLVHGVTYSSHEFDIDYLDYSLVRFLARNGYAVWRLDISGFGMSGEVEDGFMPDSEYASEDIAEAVNIILDITGERKIDVLGWSWGTVTSSIFASSHGELINRLILYAPIASGIGECDIKDPFHINTWEEAAGDFQVGNDGKIDNTITDSIVADMFFESCRDYDGKKSPNGGRRDICVDKSYSLIDFTSIKNSTLVIFGTRDPYLNIEKIKSGFDMLPEGSEMVIMDGASHAAYIEKPFYREFQLAVLNYLNRNSDADTEKLN